MGSEFLAASAGAVVGAAIAGVISYVLQRQALEAAKSQREQEKLESQHTLARSFIVRLSILYSHLGQMDRHMQVIVKLITDHADPKPEHWQVARPNFTAQLGAFSQ
jgi:hypothetical protein